MPFGRETFRSLLSKPEQSSVKQKRLAIFFDQDNPTFHEQLRTKLTPDKMADIEKLDEKVLSDSNKKLLLRLGLHARLLTMISRGEVTSLIEVLQLLSQERIHVWINASRAADDLEFLTLNRFIELLKNFEQISQYLSFGDVLRLWSAVAFIEKHDGGPIKKNATIDEICRHPKKYVPFSKLLRKYPTYHKMLWSERITAFNELREIFGVGGSVSDEELSEALFQLWQPRQSELKDILRANYAAGNHNKLKATTSQPLSPQNESSLQEPIFTKHSLKRLSTSQRVSLLSQLRNGLYHQQTIEVRAALEQALPEEHRKSWQEFQEYRLQTIDFLEHPLHPFAKICPNWGYESEARAPRDADQTEIILRALGIIGLHMGVGDNKTNWLEIAHGPYRSAVTAKTLFEAWIDSQWLNLHAERMQTCHMNVQLLKEQTVHDLNELMLLTGYAFHPKTAGSGAYYRLRMGSKKSLVNDTTYWETKGFHLVNARDFLVHLDQYSLAATAANNYEKVSLDHRCSQYAIQLADIWQDTTEELKKLIQKYDASSTPGDDLPSNKQIQAIHSTFMIPSDHLDDSIILSRKIGSDQDDSIIAAVRNLTGNACSKIETVMMEMQSEVFYQLNGIASTSGVKHSRRKIDFIRNFPEYDAPNDITRLVYDLLPRVKPFLARGNTLPRPI